MDINQILKKKRDGKELTNKEIHYFVNGLLDDSMQDSQIGAMLMAIYIRGITTAETETLTKEMVYSGDVLKWNKEWSGSIVDKHSTGGVGDKISIPLAPALAACGLKVPMISGRGLDFTGGTLDKLESIPGFKVYMSKSDLENALKASGCFIAGSTTNICPADRVLYKMRDATSTVDYYNLITSSIISKKAAEGIDYLVMDLKVGEASFMKDIESARTLANQLINVSKSLGIVTRVILTRMDSPLGRSVGNALEIIEAIKVMSGEDIPHVKELVVHIGGNLMKMSGKVNSVEEGEEKIKQALENGKALKHFKRMIICQGVSEETSNRLCEKQDWKLLPSTKYQTSLKAVETGWITDIRALSIAKVCFELGSGKTSENDRIDYGVGVDILKVAGERVELDETWIRVHHSSPALTIDQTNAIKNSIKISPEKPTIPNLLIEVIG